MKLVDADALQNSLRQAILNNTELYPNYVSHGMQTAIEQIDNAPDASQPLRERVAELEADKVEILVRLAMLVETIEYHAAIKAWFDGLETPGMVLNKSKETLEKFKAEANEGDEDHA